jgi:hypothetical protein
MSLINNQPYDWSTSPMVFCSKVFCLKYFPRSDFFRKSAMATVGTTLILLGSPSLAQGAIFGVKSQASGPSSAPSVLYSFEEDQSGFAEIGTVTLDGTEIDVDGLALSKDFGLLGFQVAEDYSQLIGIDPTTAISTAIGSPLLNTEIRGAVFDGQGNLFGVDAANDQLLSIYPFSGSILNSVGLSSDVNAKTDIAVDSGGDFFLVSSNKLNSLDVASGLLSEIFVDTEFQRSEPFGSSETGYAGLAFSAVEGDSDLLAYDIHGFDDIYRFSLSNYDRSLVHADIVPAFNSGLGDLASIPLSRSASEPTDVPEPMAVLALGALGLGLLTQRRS